MPSRNWISIDEDGYEQQLARLPKHTVLFELIQNGIDQETAEVRASIRPLPNRPVCEIIVEDDDPEGFRDLSSAYTMFAASDKRKNPEKRGRFTIGEKQVLVRCEEATIETTKGTVRFDKAGRHVSKKGRAAGTVFTGLVRMTRDEARETIQQVRKILPPPGKRILLNGEPLPGRPILQTLDGIWLWTERADEDGFMRRALRSCAVTLHALEGDEPAMLYEMGIPVVALTGGEPFHINVGQRVPLNPDRDNVSDSYRRELRAEILNRTFDSIKGSDAAAKPWIREAIGTDMILRDAVQAMLVERFGPNMVSHSPTNTESSKVAMHSGYTVVPGGALSGDEWHNAKRFNIIAPAPEVFPTNLESVEARVLSEDQLTEGMKRLRTFVAELSEFLVGQRIASSFFTDTAASVLAQFEGGRISFNVQKLKEAWFEEGLTQDQLDLVLHELGHVEEADHLSKKFNDALTKFGAKLAFKAARDPLFLLRHKWMRT